MWRDASISLSLSHSHLPLPSRTLPSLRNKPLPSGCSWPNHPPGVSNVSYVGAHHHGDHQCCVDIVQDMVYWSDDVASGYIGLP